MVDDQPEKTQASYDRDTGKVVTWTPPTEEEFRKEWSTPVRAVNLLVPLYGNTSTCQKYIMTRLKSGIIAAVASDLEFSGITRQMQLIDRRLWEQCSAFGSDHFWDTGDEEFEVGDSIVRAFDIRFEFSTIFGVRENRPPNDSNLIGATPRAVGSRGGASRKGWWDDLWIEMIRRIQAGDLKPKSAAHLQRLMMDWLAEQDEYPGEDTLKKTARKLFKYLQE